jgi:Holliday junction resolvase RusA-like endonuclease
MEIEIAPVAKPRMTQRDRWARRACVLRYFAFRDAFRPVMAILKPLEGYSITFIVPMPMSWSKKQKIAMDGEPHMSRPDIDNFLKGVLDCLPEDKHIWKIQMEKRWGLTGRILINPI